jgi:SlyX protein
MAAEGLAKNAEGRLEEIESKLALAEDLLESLNLTVYRQQQQIERLERALLSVREQVEAGALAQDPAAPKHELPPHY